MALLSVGFNMTLYFRILTRRSMVQRKNVMEVGSTSLPIFMYYAMTPNYIFLQSQLNMFILPCIYVHAQERLDHYVDITINSLNHINCLLQKASTYISFFC